MLVLIFSLSMHLSILKFYAANRIRFIKHFFITEFAKFPIFILHINPLLDDYRNCMPFCKFSSHSVDIPFVVKKFLMFDEISCFSGLIQKIIA